MGQGMVIATSEPDAVLEAAENYGIRAKEIGLVTKTPLIKIRNQGAGNDSEWLEFAKKAA